MWVYHSHSPLLVLVGMVDMYDDMKDEVDMAWADIGTVSMSVVREEYFGLIEQFLWPIYSVLLFIW
jgi:hypothetical protein